MSRTFGRRVVKSVRTRQGTIVVERPRRLGSAVSNAVESLEQRWLLSGEGLQGSYFESANNAADYNADTVIYSTRKGARVDPTINFIQQGTAANQDPNGGGAFNYNGNPSNNRIENTGLTDDQYFTARWEGTITIPATGTYTFATRSDDGVRLWINGANVVDKWNLGRDVNPAPGDLSTGLTFTAGQQIPVLLEFNQGLGGAGVGLYWSYTPDAGGFQDFQFIPQVDLNSAVAAPAAPTGPVTPGVLGATANGAFAADLTWTDNANNEAYYLIQKSSDGGTTWTTVTKVRPDNNANGTRTFSVGGLSPLTSYKFRVTVRNFSNENAAPSAADTITSATVITGAPPVDSPGLVGQYFEAPGNANYDRDKVSSSTPVGVRIDPQVDFLDATGGTGQEQGPFNGTFNGVNVTNNRIGGTGLADDQQFTARWEGTLTVPTDGVPGAENFTFFTRSDDGIRLVLGDTNGDTLINHWNDNRGVPALPGDTSQVVALTKGQSYPILIEFNQGGGGAGAGVYWKSDTQVPSQAIIPAFNPGNPNGGGYKFHVDLPAAPSNLAVTQPGGQTEFLNWADNSNNEARFRIDYKPVGAPDSAYVIGAAYAGPNATSAIVRGLTQNTNYTFRLVAINYAGATIDTTTLNANTGSTVDLGPGLIGEYREAPNNTNYQRENVSNFTPVGIRLDPIINFIPQGTAANQDPNGGGNMNGRIAGTGLADDQQFTVRWEGVLKVPGTNDGSFGTYTLHVRSDDGERLWVNGIKITDQWNADRDFPAQPGDFGTVTVRHGTEVPVVLEFNQGGGGAGAVLYVENPAEGIAETIIPTSFMEAKVALPANPTGGSATATSPVQVTLNWTDNALNEARYRIEQAVETSPGVFSAFTPVRFVTPVYDNTTDPNNPVGTGAGTVTIGSLTPGKNYKFRIYAMNYAGDSTPIEVSATTPVGGPGVIAQYFNSPTATGNEPYFYNRNTGAVLTPDVTRVDPNINTNWGTGSPDPLINGDNFMSRYSGKITITQPGTYTFRVNSDDAAYAWVNGRLVSQYPGGHGFNNGATNFPITLAAGTYPFVYEQAEGGGGAAAFFYYTGPDSPTETIVPTSALTAASDLPTAATSLTGTGGPTTIALTWNDAALNEYLARVEYKLHSSSTWTVAQTYDVLNNPNSAPAAQSLTISGLAPNSQYDVRVIDTNFAGDAIAAITVNTQVVPPGSVTVKTPTVATGDHNLTTEGNLDWIHFGYPNDPTRVHLKGGVVGPQLAPYTVIGAATVTAYNTTGDTFTWTDAAGGAVSATDVTNPGDAITGIPTNGNAPNEDVTKAIDNNTATKYLNFSKLGTGFIVTPASGASLIGGISLTSAADAPERDPATYEVWGSNDGGATFTLISSGNVPAFTSRGQERIINFPRAAGQTYTTYKVDFPTVANAALANSMQVAEVKLLAAAPGENAAATPNAVAITGDGKGFHLNLPASTLTRRVHLYIGVDGGQANLAFTLSDGSVLGIPNATLIDDNPSGPKLVMYEIDYKSGLDNQTLGVDLTAAGGGTVILSAASWIEFVAPAAPTTVAAVAASKGKINLSWTDNSNNEQGFKIERATTANGTYTTVGVTAPNITQFVDSGLTDNTQYFYKVSALNLAGTVPAANLPVNATTRTITQTGLRAKFWNDEGADTHNGQNSAGPVLIRRDDNINVNWGNGSPDPSVNVDNFSSEWDGTYIADYTGPTTFFTDTDDGGRFFIDLNGNGAFEWDPNAAGTTLPNGELVVNSWVDQGLGIDGVNDGRGIVVNLVAGQAYQILFQQFEHGGGAGAFLYAQTPFTQQNIIDTSNFVPPVLDTTPPTVTGIEVDRKLPNSATYTSAQHIVAHFSEGVGGSRNAVTISQLTGGGGVGSVYTGLDVVWTYDSASNSAIITLPGNADLPDGNYRLTLSSSGISDFSGNHLDGNADGTAGDDFNYDFYILKGDTQAAYNGNYNGDRKISFIEYQRLELNYGKTATDRVSAAEGDFNHDGVIDDQDVKWFFDHNGNTLAPPAPSAPVSAPAPAPAPVTTTTKTTTKVLTKPTPKPAPKPAPKPVAKPLTKPVLVTTPPKTTFATKKITSLKDLLSGK
jgi:hypothetical protein